MPAALLQPSELTIRNVRALFAATQELFLRHNVGNSSKRLTVALQQIIPHVRLAGSIQANDKDYGHKVIDHAEKYVDGRVHNNGLENFWSLLKRGISGTYVSVEPFHLFRYLDEQGYRYNHRKLDDGGRFDLAVRQVVGKRLTYSELTGKTVAQA